MKREIKFKFWLGHTKKMTYDHSIIDISHLHWDFTEDIIPLQFTGIIDKNENEIYEGDIVTQGELTGEVCMWVENGSWVVVYNPPSFCMHLCRGKWEILGNIYDNPELLNGTN